jgi:two-component system, chemotaxis family, sensor kinase CheA
LTEDLPEYGDILACSRRIVLKSSSTIEERQKALAYTISYFQNIAKELSRGTTPRYSREQFENELESFTSGAVNTDAALTRISENESLVNEFAQNATQYMDEVEGHVLALEKDELDDEQINSIFRFFHTLKSEANILCLVNLGTLAHRIEDLLASVRDKARPFDEQIATFLLFVVDELKRYLTLLLSDKRAAIDESFSAVDTKMEALLVPRSVAEKSPEKNAAIPAHSVPEKKEEKSSVADVSAPAGFMPRVPELDLSEGTEMITEFMEEAQEHLRNAENEILTLENDPKDKDAVNLIFRAFHTIKGVCSFFNFNDIKDLAHTSETMLDLVRKDSLAFDAVVADATLTSIDQLRTLLALLSEQVAGNGVLNSPYFDIGPQLGRLERIISDEVLPPHPPEKKIGQIMVDEGMISSEELDRALAMQDGEEKEKLIGEILKSIDAASDKNVKQAVKIQSGKIDSSIKISVEKLDTLIDLVGELVISETQVVKNQAIGLIQDQRLTKDLSELDRITRTLQSSAMSMRLIPVKPTFQKMMRIIRDLSRKAGKEINVVLKGEDTEIDKNMVELISDPLIHMVRNAADHGIEPSATRREKGKPEDGTITLAAFHKGGNIVIEIRDDGGGLNKEKILEKARSKGLIKPDEVPPDKRIWALIFEPGFSTAEKVTDVSGRGVGMDVVRKNIEQLRGRIEIASEEGKGSCFSIHIPLTLAIIEGIVCRFGKERYIVPISSVVEFVSPEVHKLTNVVGHGDVYKFHEEVLPILYLDRLFKVNCVLGDFSAKILCIFESEYGRFCIVLDEIIGQQQVVIKSLGERLQGLKGVSGGAILSDGRVGLILDVNGLVEYYKEIHDHIHLATE